METLFVHSWNIRGRSALPNRTFGR